MINWPYCLTDSSIIAWCKGVIMPVMVKCGYGVGRNKIRANNLKKKCGGNKKLVLVLMYNIFCN